ncbi:MAG: hypothetical protein Q8R28_06345 [Dehalococcoidia bacterium]|nr:hypothetical protein [Dehalococcoidia bacterium]
MSGIFVFLAVACGPAALSTPTPVPATPAPTATSAPTSTPIPPPTFVSICNTGGIGAYIRTEPDGEGMMAWPDGARLRIIGPDQTVGGEVWRNLQDERGNQGWTRADYLCAAGASPATPTVVAVIPTPSKSSSTATTLNAERT